MLGFLFRTLTAEPDRGAELFEALTAQARMAHWYVEGGAPDTIDGRFAILATLTALTLVRLEQSGGEGDLASVALTERFIHVMEAEHRELGLGDPKLGRTVRRLVGSLARRIELWRAAAAGERDWNDAARESVYKADPAPAQLAHSAKSVRTFWSRLQDLSVSAIAEGRIR